jgi:translation elongation factor P/translation initiation factor 5A
MKNSVWRIFCNSETSQGGEGGDVVLRHLRFLKEGDRLRLKDNALPHVKTREWIFKQEEGTSLLLMHEKEYYGLSVKASQINWQEYNRRKRKEICSP